MILECVVFFWWRSEGEIGQQYKTKSRELTKKISHSINNPSNSYVSRVEDEETPSTLQ